MFKAPLIIKSLTIGFTALILSACGSSSSSTVSSSTPELDAAIQDVVDKTIIPASANFKSQAEALDSNAELFCSANNTNEQNLASLQLQWQQTNNAWFQLLPFKFGPMEGSVVFPTYTYIDSYRVNGNNYIETVRTEINTLLNSSDEINDATFTNKTFNKVGLLALEASIFETNADQSTSTNDIVSEYVGNDSKCDILTGYSAQLLRRASIIDDRWTTDYQDSGSSYRDLLLSGQLEGISGEDGSDATTKIVLGAQNYFDYIANRNVTDSVGTLANSIWSALDVSVDITEELMTGTDSTTISLFDIIRNTNSNDQDVNTITSNFDYIRTTISDTDKTNLQAAAKALDSNFKVEVTTGLDINAGLSFADGD